MALPKCTCGCPEASHMGLPRGCIKHGFHQYEAKKDEFMDVRYTPMSIDGESGYFLSDEEYQKLYRAAIGEDHSEYISELEIENSNLRNVVEDTYTRVQRLAYDLGNA